MWTDFLILKTDESINPRLLFLAFLDSLFTPNISSRLKLFSWKHFQQKKTPSAPHRRRRSRHLPTRRHILPPHFYPACFLQRPGILCSHAIWRGPSPGPVWHRGNLGTTLPIESLHTEEKEKKKKSRSFVQRWLDTGSGEKINWQMYAARLEDDWLPATAAEGYLEGG